MDTCTFFGHADTPKEIEPILKSTLVDLIKNKNVNKFYVGNHGGFDSMAKNTLKDLKKVYPDIKYYVVLAYMPSKKNELDYEDYSDTIYPDELENTPPKYAIDKRNRWMIDKSDTVITYVNRDFGGAARFKKIAQRKDKIVINLYDFFKEGFK